MKVLVAEDDAHTRAGLVEILEAEGYTTFAVANGAEARRLMKDQSPDFICLDIMMPDVDGFTLCREIRRENASIPIVFITAKSEEIDKVLGLELGADDFIVKPFGVKEVIARVRAVTRRCLANRQEAPDRQEFHMGDLRVAPSALRAFRGDRKIELSLRDVKIVELLYMNPGKAIDRNTLFERCWGMLGYPNSRAIDQQISQLRKRIEKDPKNPTIIMTVHGVGYRYDE
jgi:DNA-binding response OmpR family regulator